MSHLSKDEGNTKQQILKAATQVFAEKGFSGATVKDLATAAGVNVAMISYYFDGKEGLYCACLLEFGMERLNSAQMLLKEPLSGEDFRSKLRLWTEHFLQTSMENHGAARIMFRELDLNMQHSQDIFKNTFLATFQRMQDFFAEASSKGFLRADLDPLPSVSLLMGALTTAVRFDIIGEQQYGVTLKDPAYRAKLAHNYVTSFCDGVLKP